MPADRPMRMSAQGTSLGRKLAAWFVLAAGGNFTIVFALVVLAELTPLNVSIDTSLEVLHAFISPLYSTELLFFTTVLSLLAALSGQPLNDAYAEGNRKIARALQLATTTILSGAAIMVWSQPTSAAFVAFAVLLAFVSYVLAERLAPAQLLSAEQRYLLAYQNHARRSRWANDALGAGWQTVPRQRTWPALTLYTICPIVVMTISGTLYSMITWGIEWATHPTTVVMMGLLSFGPILLTFAWIATANKADSPSTRRWTVSVFAAVGALASALFAGILFVAGPTVGGLGWLILAVTALHAIALWLPAPWIGRRKLVGVAAAFTSRSLERSSAARTEAGELWNDEQARAGKTSGFWERLLRSTAGDGFISGPLRWRR